VHRVAPRVEARVHLGTDRSDGIELFVKLDAPQSSRLFGPIERQVQTADIIFLPRLGSDRKLDVHLLVHLCVEEGRLYSHVVNFPVLGRRHREERACRGRAGHWCLYLIKVAPRHLVEALRHQSRLVPSHVALRIVLDVVHVARFDSLTLVAAPGLEPGTKLLVCAVLFFLNCFPARRVRSRTRFLRIGWRLAQVPSRRSSALGSFCKL